MPDVAIRVEGLGKAYRIGLKEQQHETMLGAMAAWVKSPFQNFRNVRNLSSFGDLRTQGPKDSGSQSPALPSSQSPSVPESQSPLSDIIWALKDVSFEVKHGEAVGIIGRNGSGKSTLLKILSRVTEPTRGRATVYGRVASLLEVGTGFHPDLTGRENVYLNGTILGMKKREIDTRFDEIVDFSGVEKFIDTPVKRYSSGMRVRLAFAVAAHLEPEILIVDEVLAVGDAQFQKKCLGKMQDMAGHGRTVLFVSHNMQTIRHLCSRVILMEGGKDVFSGAAHTGVARYMGQDASKSGSSINLSSYARGVEPQYALLDRIEFLEPGGAPARRLLREGALRVDVYFTVTESLEHLDIPMAVVHVEGQRVFSECYSDHFHRATLQPGQYRVSFEIPLRFLKLESYFLVVGLYNESRYCDLVEGIPLPELVDPTANSDVETHRWGFVRIPVEWTSVVPVGIAH